MERSPVAGCCVTRFLGGESGCCPGIADGKPFQQEYVRAVEKTIRTTGVLPDLDARVIQKLQAINEWERLQALPTGKAAKPPSRILTIFTAPFRWLWHQLTGFYEDLKLLFSGKRAGA